MKIGRMVGPAIATHAGLTTGVHGVGADSIISDAEVTALVGDALTAAIGAIGIHSDLDTGVHGVGESTVQSAVDVAALIATHDGLAAPHSAAGFAKLTVAETEVHPDGAGPSAWTDLDLSSAVGANYALVMLRISCTDASGIHAYFRQNGDASEMGKEGAASTGDAILANGTSAYVILPTDSGGIIEWKLHAALTCVVDVIAYIK